MTPEVAEQACSPFFTTKVDGSGLGLSVVHGIVTEYGGEIDVSTVSGGGTCFCVTLRLDSESERVERVGT